MTITMERPAPTTEAYTTEEQEIFRVEKVNEWRGQQLTEYRRRRNAASFGDEAYHNEFVASVDEELTRYLAVNGISPETSPHYQEIYDLFRASSIDMMDESAWSVSAESRGLHGDTTRAGEVEAHEHIYQRLNGHRTDEHTTTDHYPNADPRDPDVSVENLPLNNDQQNAERASMLETLSAELDTLRAEWADLSAKRSGKLFGKKNEDHEKLEARYNAAVQAHGREHLREVIRDDLTDEHKNAIVVAYLFDEQDRLRNDITARLNGTKVGKFVSFMNTGTKWQRVGKGIAVGFGAGLVGSVLAGAAGAAVVGAGTVAAAKFARGYARHDKRGLLSTDDHFDQESVVEAVTHERAQLAPEETEDRFMHAQHHFNLLLEDQTKDQQKKRRIAMAWGAGSVALGTVLGYSTFWLSSQISHNALSGPDFQLAHPFGERDYLNTPNHDLRIPHLPDDIDVDGPDVPNIPGIDIDEPKAPNLHDLDHDGIPDNLDPDIDGDHMLNDDDFKPRDPMISEKPVTIHGDGGSHDGDISTPETKLQWDDFDHEARMVRYSEGGFETLKELGVPQQKWETVWESVGNKLAEEGKTYRMDDGRWGWSREMRLSDHDLSLFVRAASENGVHLS